VRQQCRCPVCGVHVLSQQVETTPTATLRIRAGPEGRIQPDRTGQWRTSRSAVRGGARCAGPHDARSHQGRYRDAPLPGGNRCRSGGSSA